MTIIQNENKIRKSSTDYIYWYLQRLPFLLLHVPEVDRKHTYNTKKQHN